MSRCGTPKGEELTREQWGRPESVEYWPQRALANKALSTGTFTQRVEL